MYCIIRVPHVYEPDVTLFESQEEAEEAYEFYFHILDVAEEERNPRGWDFTDEELANALHGKVVSTLCGSNSVCLPPDANREEVWQNHVRDDLSTAFAGPADDALDWAENYAGHQHSAVLNRARRVLEEWVES